MKKAIAILTLLILGAAIHYGFQVVFQPAPALAQVPITLAPDGDKHDIVIQRVDVSANPTTMTTKVPNRKVVGFSCVGSVCWIALD